MQLVQLGLLLLTGFLFCFGLCFFCFHFVYIFFDTASAKCLVSKSTKGKPFYCGLFINLHHFCEFSSYQVVLSSWFAIFAPSIIGYHVVLPFDLSFYAIMSNHLDLPYCLIILIYHFCPIMCLIIFCFIMIFIIWCVLNCSCVFPFS